MSSSQSLYLVLIILHTSLFLSAAVPRHRPPSFSPEALNATTATPTLTTYFEVTKPINRPKTKPCSYHLLHHDFGNTYGHPPVFANYTPPANCPAKNFSTIILEWSATCKGVQYDRIFGVWLGGVELLRSCTAEPRPNGNVWKVDKDITRYSSLLMSNQTLVVYLGNVVNTNYTGIYHVDISILFYPAPAKANSVSGGRNWADLILPISRNSPVNDGLWFTIENSTDIETKEFEIPLNSYRAVLEIYVSFHQKDEFWYNNPPNDYTVAHNLTGTGGNGPFREVVVTLDDGVLVGVVWPFTVIYTGGINPLLWTPISGIGSFDLPTYDIELTPFLGSLLDGRKHRIGFGVTNALNLWFIDANLHLWLDKRSSRTTGKVFDYHASPLSFSMESDFRGLSRTLVSTKAKRSIYSTGWVSSSHGKITTSFAQHLSLNNFMVIGDGGNMQTVNQTIEFNTSIGSLSFNHLSNNKTFDLYLYMDVHGQDESNYVEVDKAALGLKEERIHGDDDGSGYSTSSLRNSHTGEGNLVVQEGVVSSGWGRTQEVYKYESNNEPCYSRNVSSSNYTIIHDEVINHCSS